MVILFLLFNLLLCQLLILLLVLRWYDLVLNLLLFFIIIDCSCPLPLVTRILLSRLTKVYLKQYVTYLSLRIIVFYNSFSAVTWFQINITLPLRNCNNQWLIYDVILSNTHMNYILPYYYFIKLLFCWFKNYNYNYQNFIVFKIQPWA